MFRVRAVEFQFCLQRDAEGEAPLDALVDGVTRRVNGIVEKLEHKVIPGIGNGEVIHEDLIKALSPPVLGCSSELEKLGKRFKLNLKKIRVFKLLFLGCEIDSFVVF